MSKTIRRVNPKLKQSILRNKARDAADIRPLHPDYVRRQDRILRGQDGAISYDKCQTAHIDSEGGYKLDTWSECHAKHHGQEAKRKLRRAGKILAARQLEDI